MRMLTGMRKKTNIVLLICFGASKMANTEQSGQEGKAEKAEKKKKKAS